MLFDLFSSVDYYCFFYFPFNGWFISGIIFLVCFSVYFLGFSYFGFLFGFVRCFFFGLFKVSHASSLRGFSGLLLFCFLGVFFSNVWGLVPYIYGITTQMAIVFGFSLCVWLSVFIGGVFCNVFLFLSHLVPSGSPLVLSVPLSYIEFISNVIRPVTLSLRLSINMTTGHVLVGLLGTSCVVYLSTNLFVCFWFILLFSFYGLFEVFISYIQSLVYYSLFIEYTGESFPSGGYNTINKGELFFFSVLC